MIPNLVTKQGYVLVKPTSGVDYNLHPEMLCATIIAGADAHKGAIVFYNEDSFLCFDDQYVLVKVEDILAWIKPEEKQPDVQPEVSVEVVNEDSQA